LIDKHSLLVLIRFAPSNPAKRPDVLRLPCAGRSAFNVEDS